MQVICHYEGKTISLYYGSRRFIGIETSDVDKSLKTLPNSISSNTAEISMEFSASVCYRKRQFEYFFNTSCETWPFCAGSNENELEIKSVLIQHTLGKLKFKLI